MRIRYHVAIVIAIAIAAIASIAVALMMSYDSGADAMHNWFFTAFPRAFYPHRRYLKSAATLVSASGCSSARCSWPHCSTPPDALAPHTIGLIMLVNPLMRTYCSLPPRLAAKALVTRYSNKRATAASAVSSSASYRRILHCRLAMPCHICKTRALT